MRGGTGLGIDEFDERVGIYLGLVVRLLDHLGHTHSHDAPDFGARQSRLAEYHSTKVAGCTRWRHSITV